MNKGNALWNLGVKKLKKMHEEGDVSCFENTFICNLRRGEEAANLMCVVATFAGTRSVVSFFAYQDGEKYAAVDDCFDFIDDVSMDGLVPEGCLEVRQWSLPLSAMESTAVSCY